MIIIGYKYVSFATKDTGELVEYAEIYLGNKSDDTKKEYGVQVERVTMGKANYSNYDLRQMMEDKTQVVPSYNKYGKCQALIKI